MRRITVVGAVIVRDGHILAARRGPKMSLAGLWEFPGGKVEPGEDPREALAREIREELDVVTMDLELTSPAELKLYNYLTTSGIASINVLAAIFAGFDSELEWPVSDTFVCVSEFPHCVCLDVIYATST